jgi:ectoine hydroxylase-related dioxygenase (phytanoyl-CoA dioxygenase family)
MNFDQLGYAINENIISSEQVAVLVCALSKLQLEPLRGGIRRIEQLVPEVAELAASSAILQLATRHLIGRAELVRAIYFDKSPANNWLVTWHQDRTVAVTQRFELAGWQPWSHKAGAWHVQPPLEVLENMVTIRIHLDATSKANGCLKILPRSHHFGLLPSELVRGKVPPNEVVYCELGVGGVVVMRPHIFHASEKSIALTPRRILHFEFSSYALPDGVSWAT